MSTELSTEAGQLDQVKVYNFYVTFAGDIERTAIALSIDPDLVAELANTHGWHQKVKALAMLPTTGSEESIQVNRTVNFAQARRLRDIVDNVAQELFSTPEQTRKTLTVPVKGGGTQLSAKPVTELVKAAEAVHAMTYRALGDGTEAGKGGGGDSDETIKKLSVTIMRGLNQLVEKNTPIKPADVVTDV